MTTDTDPNVIAGQSNAAGESSSTAAQGSPAGETTPTDSSKSTTAPSSKPTTMRGVVATTTVCALLAAGGHGVIWLAYAFRWQTWVPWQPITGIVLVVVAIVAFGGYYLSSRRTRVAIAASFILMFFVCLSYVLTLPPFVTATQAEGARELFADFRNMVVVILGFYFGSEAAISITKILGIALSKRGDSTQDIQRADRDYAQPEKPAQQRK